MKEQELIIATLQEEIQRYETWIQQAYQAIIDEKISNYPILIALQSSTTELPIGIELLDKKKLGSIWGYRISTLEQLVQHSIVSDQKKTDFIQLYKQKQPNYCVLAIGGENSLWVFVPSFLTKK